MIKILNPVTVVNVIIKQARCVVIKRRVLEPTPYEEILFCDFNCDKSSHFHSYRFYSKDGASEAGNKYLYCFSSGYL